MPNWPNMNIFYIVFFISGNEYMKTWKSYIRSKRLFGLCDENDEQQQKKKDSIKLMEISIPPQSPNPDRSFFESILPMIKDFDDDMKLDYRTEILQLTQRFNNSLKNKTHNEKTTNLLSSSLTVKLEPDIHSENIPNTSSSIIPIQGPSDVPQSSEVQPKSLIQLPKKVRTIKVKRLSSIDSKKLLTLKKVSPSQIKKIGNTCNLILPPASVPMQASIKKEDILDSS